MLIWQTPLLALILIEISPRAVVGVMNCPLMVVRSKVMVNLPFSMGKYFMSSNVKCVLTVLPSEQVALLRVISLSVIIRPGGLMRKVNVPPVNEALNFAPGIGVTITAVGTLVAVAVGGKVGGGGCVGGGGGVSVGGGGGVSVGGRGVSVGVAVGAIVGVGETNGLPPG